MPNVQTLLQSEHLARQTFERMNMREVAIASGYEPQVMADLRMMAATEPEEGEKAFARWRDEACAAFGLQQTEQRKPFAFSQGIAVIPISGTLLNRFSGSWGYVTGYNAIRSQLNAALADDDVKGIVFDVNSYGGEAAGCFELSSEIFASRAVKPSLAVVDSNALSGGYALASAASQMAVIPSGQVGSIGVVMMHVDMSAMLENWGIKVNLIHSGKHKVDGHPYGPLPDEVRAEFQAGTDETRQKFADQVGTNRNLDASVAYKTEAQIYRAEAAKSLGLVDAITSPQSAVQAFFVELSNGSSQLSKEVSMTTETTKPGEDAENAAATRTAERTRVQGIISCEEASSRPKLAQHLAFNTSMSVDEAKAMLTVAATETKVESDAKAAPEPDRFKQAMDASAHPNIGEEGVTGVEQDSSLAAANAILAAQAAAKGIPFKA